MEAQLVAKESPEGNNISIIIRISTIIRISILIRISIIIRISISNCIIFRVLG